MVQRRQRERSLFEVLLPDGHKLWPEWLRKIDVLLDGYAAWYVNLFGVANYSAFGYAGAVCAVTKSAPYGFGHAV